MILPLCLVLSIDVSSSFEPLDYQSVMHGHANALTQQRIIDTVESLGGSFAITIQQWAEVAVTSVDWRIITTRAELEELASVVGDLPRAFRGGTWTHVGMAYAMHSFDSAPIECDRKTIDIVSDGPAGVTVDHVTALRDTAYENGIRINTLGVTTYYGGGEEDGPVRSATYPNPENWLREYVMTPNGFSMAADGMEEFQRAIAVKLSLELALLEMENNHEYQ